MLENTIKCKLCGLVCSMQISATHLRAAHNMTTKEYRALGHKTLSPARLEQLRNSPVAQGKAKHYRGKEHWNYKGGHITGTGYKIIYDDEGNRCYEHRYIAEQMMGRPLKSNEVVHHKDANRSNNDPSNLVVMKRAEHNKYKDGVRRYFNTGPIVEEAARDLFNIGWSQNRISRALRVDQRSVSFWLSKSD